MAEGKPRILFVDDEPSILKIVSKHLELAGFEVLIATNGEEGLSKARAERPDAIILDLMMPKRSGLEVCLTLRKEAQFQQTPIILFTGKEHDDVVANLRTNDRLKEWGASAFVKKGEGAATLIRHIREMLASASPS